jgi:hypothetical protein
VREGWADRGAFRHLRERDDRRLYARLSPGSVTFGLTRLIQHKPTQAHIIRVARSCEFHEAVRLGLSIVRAGRWVWRQMQPQNRPMVAMAANACLRMSQPQDCSIFLVDKTSRIPKLNATLTVRNSRICLASVHENALGSSISLTQANPDWLSHFR